MRKEKARPVWLKWGTMAACLCLMLVGGIVILQKENSTSPNPAPVQIANPFIAVATVEEMEQYLDFDVPVLDKEVESYSVFVVDNYPTLGQIVYTDGSKFRIQYGSGDISGVYGGTLEETKDIDGVMVEYCKYEDITYAIWEQKGFTFSYIYTASAEVEAIIQQFK